MPPIESDAGLNDAFLNRFELLYQHLGDHALRDSSVPLCLEDHSVGILDRQSGSIAVLHAIGYEIATTGPAGTVVCTNPFEPVSFEPELRRSSTGRWFQRFSAAFSSESDYLHAVVTGLRERYNPAHSGNFIIDGLRQADKTDINMLFGIRLAGARAYTPAL
jgi:hypothetical protein